MDDSAFDQQCKREGLLIRALLAEHYTREPGRRQEERLTLKLADALESRRKDVTFCEWSETWNQKQGQMP